MSECHNIPISKKGEPSPNITRFRTLSSWKSVVLFPSSNRFRFGDLFFIHPLQFFPHDVSWWFLLWYGKHVHVEKYNSQSLLLLCLENMDAKGFVRLNEGEQERDSFGDSPAAAQRIVAWTFRIYKKIVSSVRLVAHPRKSSNSKVIIFDYLPNPLKNPEGLNTEQIYLIFFRVASSDLKHQNRRTFHREIS